VKRVLIIAPDFAPSSLPPATRVRFFAKHLPEFGWEPIVLTVDSRHYEAACDPENEQLLSPSLEVIRTGAFSTRWTRKFGVGDIGMRSLWQHWRAIKLICRERKIDLIFIPVPPYVPMVLGRLAHARFGIPYVIDYIDPWVTEYYWKLPKAQRPPKWRASYWLSRTLEPFALRRVSHITGVSKGTTDGVIDSYSWLAPEDATEIPYGAEAGDFEYLRQHPRANSIFDPNDGLLHMSYVGACIPGMHAAVRTVFQAVRAGLDRSPETFERLRLHFVGTSYAAKGHAPRGVLALARQAGIESLVDEHPSRIPYLTSLQVMIDSRALLLVGSDESHYTASKVFPYILAERPLLAVLHEDSSAVETLRETNVSNPITFDRGRPVSESVTELSTELERILGLPREHEPDTNWDVFEQCTTTSMTARLVTAFEKALSTSGKQLQSTEPPHSNLRSIAARAGKPLRVLIPFNTVSLYGMERGVIETFDLLRPEVEPIFLMSLTTRLMNLPVLEEIERRGLSYSFFSDKKGWPKIGRPRSLKDVWRMSIAMIRGNLDVLKAARGHDFIYVASVSYFYFIVLAAVFHRLQGKRIIFQFHDLVSTASARLRFTSWFATDFVHNTSYGMETVRRSNPCVARKKNWVIPSPIVRGEVSKPGNDAADFNGKGRHILFVGQVARHKGVDVLLDAFSLLQRSHKDITLHIVGGCDDSDLKSRINGSNGNSGIRYWGYRDDVLDIMKMADLLVPPSPSATNESFGRVVTEAMSVGTPTVCFRSGALQEIVSHEQTGLICEAETVESLALNIERLLNDNLFRERCGRSARSRFEEFYGEAEIKKRWLQVLA
jgi:glycosyltransferase involved in cell wall biosynthesis